jgi:hypothetical protein
MGGGGRGDRLVEELTDDGFTPSTTGAGPAGEGLFGAPGPGLAAALEGAVDPGQGSWPVGTLPDGASTQPWQQVMHAVVAGRRLAGWALWGQLSMLARLLVAWQACPPVSNEVGVPDRCADDDPALAERLNSEIGRSRGALLAGGWGMASEMTPMLAAAEVGLACGLSRTAAARLVDVAEAVLVQNRLPRLRRLLRAGWVDWYKLDFFVRDTAHLDDVVVAAVERMILGDLEPDDCLDVLADPSRPGLGLPPIVTMTVPEMRAAVAAAVAAIDAEAAARRASKARAGRRVQCQANPTARPPSRPTWPWRLRRPCGMR